MTESRVHVPVGRRSCLSGPLFLSRPRARRFHPFAQGGSEWACRRGSADPTARRVESPAAPARRYLLRWLPPRAPLLRQSPPDRPAVGSAGVRGRKALRNQPAPACGVHLARGPPAPYPAQHRQDTVRDDSADTDTRGAKTRPRLPRSARAANASRDNGLAGRGDKAPRARPGRGDRFPATGSTRPPQLGAWLDASPSRPLPDRACRSCAAPERPAGQASLLPVRLPAGSFPPFFSLGCRSVFDRPRAANLFIGLH